METLKKIFNAICAFFIRLGKALCKGLKAFLEAFKNENNE